MQSFANGGMAYKEEPFDNMSAMAAALPHAPYGPNHHHGYERGGSFGAESVPFYPGYHMQQHPAYQTSHYNQHPVNWKHSTGLQQNGAFDGQMDMFRARLNSMPFLPMDPRMSSRPEFFNNGMAPEQCKCNRSFSTDIGIMHPLLAPNSVLSSASCYNSTVQVLTSSSSAR